MASFIPGSVVLYDEPGTKNPPWPSIYCTDDVAPAWFLQTRPRDYATLVLKLSKIVDASQLCWAKAGSLSNFDPFGADEALRRSKPDLGDAYDIADYALDTGLDFYHWKAAIGSDQDDYNDTNSRHDEGDEDISNDPDMLRAIEMSMGDIRAQEAQDLTNPTADQTPQFSTSRLCSERLPPRPGVLPLPSFAGQRQLPIRGHIEQPPRLSISSSSPPSKNNTFGSYSRSLKRTSPPSSNESDNEMPTPSRKRKTNSVSNYSRQAEPFHFSSQSSQSTTSPTFTISDDEVELLPLPRQRKQSSASGFATSGHRPQQSATRSRNPNSALSASQVFMRNGLSASAAAAPNGDIIEEDFNESSEFVQVYVGPEIDPMTDPSVDPQRRRYKLQLLKHHIWDRTYFRDALSGRNYFEPIGENTWELIHPRLGDISPEDFRMVAEFLSDGSFGIRDPETEEQVAEAFAECMSAWKTAELLSMDDLLEHIVEKVRSTRPWWDLFNVMLFVCFIYDNEVPLEAHNDFKNLLSDFIAEHYDIYIEDDVLRAEFMTRFKQLPELKRDVLKKIVEQSEQRLGLQEQEEVAQDEHEHDNMDLYS